MIYEIWEEIDDGVTVTTMCETNSVISRENAAIGCRLIRTFEASSWEAATDLHRLAMGWPS